MKTQQAAEREEQQRIKNLVLNYDLRDGEDQDGDSAHNPLLPNPNIHNRDAGLEKAAALTYSRPDKSGNNRSGQRARKLQLSDVDWYDAKPTFSHVEHAFPRRPGRQEGLAARAGNVEMSASKSDEPLPRPSSNAPRFADATARARRGGRLTKKAMIEAHASIGENAKSPRNK